MNNWDTYNTIYKLKTPLIKVVGIALKLVDGAKGNGFLKIDSIQLNWNLVNNRIGQSVLAFHHATG